MLKASFELLKQNHKKSINLLNSCLSSWKKTKNLNAICYNNIGVNYFKLHKFNLAHLHFVKALEEGTCIWKPSGNIDDCYMNLFKVKMKFKNCFYFCLPSIEGQTQLAV